MSGKELLEVKPPSKVSVADIAVNCGVSYDEFVAALRRWTNNG